MDDPNQGITNFTYNDFGELEKEVDANGGIIRYDMDWLGRVKWRNGDGNIANFTWDTQKTGLLTSQSEGASSKSYLYDSAARITQSDVVIDGTTYRTKTEYDDNYGRPLSMTYPDGISIPMASRLSICTTQWVI